MAGDIQHNRVGLRRRPWALNLKKETGEMQPDRLDCSALILRAGMLNRPGVDREPMNVLKRGRAIFFYEQSVERGKARRGRMHIFMDRTIDFFETSSASNACFKQSRKLRTGSIERSNYWAVLTRAVTPGPSILTSGEILIPAISICACGFTAPETFAPAGRGSSSS